MDAHEKALVRLTWEQVESISAEAAALFYARLFELDPRLRRLFASDMREQGEKLMQMIGIAVRGLDRLDELVPGLHRLGRRHVGYGVADGDYDTVGAALLWTLERGLGPSFTHEAREAWAAVYGILADTMKQGAVEGALDPAS